MRGVFVTGTDTGVGKTVVAAALVACLRRHGPAGYWKPVQTGVEQDDDTATVRTLAGCADAEVWNRGVRLERPLSPHLAARLAGRALSVDAVLADRPDDAARTWVVEGAGGVLVPLNETESMSNLMTRLGLPVVLVARSTLGTINHSLLTLEALRSRGLQVAGVVLVGPPNPENRAAVASLGHVPVLGELPGLDPLNRESLAAWAAIGLDVARLRVMAS
ncbi:MAG: dethiobiotin synthase [Vicinamibacterales bacterium]|nr:dethiobiotin synthase [Vicinamibacterales bacterium]